MQNAIILLVEDDPNDELLTLLALKKNKIASRVFVARDGAEALDFLSGKNTQAERDLHNLPQLIVLDLKLPKLDGIDVLRCIRKDQYTHFLPVVVLSSSKEERDVTKAYESGANSYIRKPVDFNQFTDYVRELGSYWLRLNENPPQ